MAISVYPVTENFAAEIGDLDLARPLDPADLAAIKAAFATYAVLIFPDQQLTQEQHLAFAARFGPLELTIAVHRKDAPLRVHKEFADVRAAYDALPEAMKRRLEGLVAEHSIFNSRGRLGFSNFSEDERQSLPPVPQALVRVIAESGRKSLYLASHAGRIFGMPDAEGRALIDQLIEHATRRQFVYTHRWRVNDLVMWDDRCTMHRGTAFDDLRFRRDVQRATVSDVANTCEQEGLSVAAA